MLLRTLYNIFKNHYLYLLIFLVLAWDLGNVSAIRQGTESFYLQISKEMFSLNHWLTPVVNGDFHWSKPPMHFWFTFPFYFLFGGPSLFAARITVVLISIFGIWYYSRFCYKYLKIDKSITILFFVATIGINKYSRIYMMEIPLTVLTSVALLYFFEEINKQKSLMIKPALLLAIASLVKGPVSLVMCFVSATIYYFIKTNILKNKLCWHSLLRWILFSIFLSSIWYVIQFLIHGTQFIDYFFLRENLGKFTAKSYPLRSVFQGLLIYAFPWSLLLTCLLIQLKTNIKHFRVLLLNEEFKKKKDALLFITISFVVFFIIWLIPNQRSHHYALPSLPFFIIAILFIFSNLGAKKQSQVFKAFLFLYLPLIFVLISILSYLLSFNDIYSNLTQLTLICTTITFLVFLSCILVSKHNLKAKLFSLFLILTSLWHLLFPAFYLPIIPTNVRKIVNNAKIYTTQKRPYFLSETLQKKVLHLSSNQIFKIIVDEKSYAILPSKHINLIQGHSKIKIISKWTIWKRKLKRKHYFASLKNKSLLKLKTEMYLIKGL